MVFSSNESAAEAGRALMAGLLATIVALDEEVRMNAGTTAVHEMRKSIRRTFTCFELFDAYFEPGTLKQYKRPLRRIMRRLAKCRDLAVLRMKFEVFNQANDRQLDDLGAYFDEQQEAADSKLKTYLSKPKRREFFEQYRAFTASRGLGAASLEHAAKEPKIRHLIPVLIFERVAAVRAFEDYVSSASLKEMHRLRIQFKELRYTLQFFEPLLGPEAPLILLDLKDSQDILGDLNDTNVALRLLDAVPDRQISVDRYRRYQHKEQERLLEAFGPVWERFSRPQWRQRLAEAAASV